MRRLKNITLEKLIAHQLDHIGGKKTISKEAKPFSDAVGTFMTQHLKKCSALQRPRAAQFDQPGGLVALSCRKILSKPSLFVEESGKIAEALYDSMGTNQNIDPGFLVVCLSKNNDENYRFLALLKMDPHSMFRARVGQSVDIVAEGQALPDPHGHLQKFAFVRKCVADSGAEILVLDMQARVDEVADFSTESASGHPDRYGLRYEVIGVMLSISLPIRSSLPDRASIASGLPRSRRSPVGFRAHSWVRQSTTLRQLPASALVTIPAVPKGGCPSPAQRWLVRPLQTT